MPQKIIAQGEVFFSHVSKRWIRFSLEPSHSLSKITVCGAFCSPNTFRIIHVLGFLLFHVVKICVQLGSVLSVDPVNTWKLIRGQWTQIVHHPGQDIRIHRNWRYHQIDAASTPPQGLYKQDGAFPPLSQVDDAPGWEAVTVQERRKITPRPFSRRSEMSLEKATMRNG
jgi:hypothetical protein